MTIAPHILGPDGPIAAALGDGYEPRPEQGAMAARIAKTFAGSGHLLVEAGTGVGKSFAYLVPAMERCMKHGETVIVATHTIALQEQLIERDIPLLMSTLDENGPESWRGSVRPILVKGRGNYMSIRRLALAGHRAGRLVPDAASRRSLQEIQQWAYETREGTLSTLPQLERPGVWDHVRSDSGNCMGRKCPHHEDCFYQSARRDMEGANLLICNHALFFSDMALKMRGVGFLPKYDHVILDEAHAVEDVAADHFGLSVSEGRVQHLLSTLYHSKTGNGYLSHLQLLAGEIDDVERAVHLVQKADLASLEFFDHLMRYSNRSDVRNGRLREPDLVENPLTPAMNDLVLRLRTLRDKVSTDADRFELNSYAERASDIADVAEALVAQTSVGCVHWVEVGQRAGRRPRVTLSCSPIEVAPLMRQHLFSDEQSVILTSATLATRTVQEDEPTEIAETAFDHTITRLGCEGAAVLQLGSPFDFPKQVEVIVDRTMPSPSAARRRSEGDAPIDYNAELCSRIMDHVCATDGGAFVLFTSFATLYAVADRLRTPLDELGHQLLAQGKDGSRREILGRFREDERAVLFGAASFWQGVDVRGRGLRNVIITRLPFDPPDRPLTEARSERLQQLGRDPFRDDAVPRAVIRFKQGFGRLIRSHRDSGMVVILDPRVLSKPYGRMFLDSLPDCRRVVERV